MSEIRKFISNNKILYGGISLYRYLVYKNKYLKLHKNINILNIQDTINFLNSSNKSLARFGDSELKMIYENYSVGFQDYNPELAKKLKEILLTQKDKVMIGLPHHLVGTTGVKFQVKTSWWSYIVRNYKQLSKLLKQSSNQPFLDSMISRTYSEYTDINITKDAYICLKKVWEDKNILIVEGNKTRMGMGNDLFSNVSSLKRIIVPNKNAFSYYKKIKLAIKSALEDNRCDIVVAAIGPTATVLAYDLSDDIRILDLGHLDIQYEYYRHRTSKMTAIEGKYTNEVKMSKNDIYQNDSKYLSQIIRRVD